MTCPQATNVPIKGAKKTGGLAKDVKKNGVKKNCVKWKGVEKKT
jgi:hypothetical protein